MSTMPRNGSPRRDCEEPRLGRGRVILLLMSVGIGPAAALDCSVSASDVAFGGVDVLAAGTTDAVGTLRIECSESLFGLLDSTVGVCVYLDAGSGGTDGASFRYLVDGANQLPFNLYKDAARTQIWGSETAFSASGAQRVVVQLNGILGLFASGSANLPVYGRIPDGQSGVAVGSYLSSFAAGARIRYSFNNNLACDGATGAADSDSFVASATVTASCSVSADDLAFGARASLATAADASSQLSVTCTKGQPYAVSLSAGASGSYALRTMTDGGSGTVSYQLYRDASRTQVWGDGSGGSTTVSATGEGKSESFPVYGRVPVQATPDPATYTDTIVVTVTW